jgi:hypothetical protein
LLPAGYLNNDPHHTRYSLPAISAQAVQWRLARMAKKAASVTEAATVVGAV